MIHADNGISALRGEIASYFAGFGDPAAMWRAFRDAAVLVPLTGDGRILTSTYHGVAWICVFTGIDEYARYLTARTGPIGDRKYPYHTVFGFRIADHAAGLPRPTGIALDILGSAPMTFPPRIDAADTADLPRGWG